MAKKAKIISSAEVVGFTHCGKMRRGHEDAFILGQHIQSAPAPFLRPPVISLAYAARPKLKDFVLALAEVVLDGWADDNITIFALKLNGS